MVARPSTENRRPMPARRRPATGCRIHRRNQPVERFELLLRRDAVHGDELVGFGLACVAQLDGEPVGLDVGLAGAVGAFHLFVADEVRQSGCVMDGDFAGAIQRSPLVFRSWALRRRRYTKKRAEGSEGQESHAQFPRAQVA